MPALFSIEQTDRGRSWVHRLDVRTKLGMAVLASLTVLVLNQPAALGSAAVASGFYAVSLKRWKVLVAVYTMIVFIGVAAIAMMAGIHAIWPRMTALDPAILAIPFLRTMVVLNVSLALALSSSVQSLMVTLKTLRLPFSIYVPLSIMIRFVPTFVEDVRPNRGVPAHPGSPTDTGGCHRPAKTHRQAAAHVDAVPIDARGG